MNFQDCCFNVVEHTLKACWVLTNSCNLECDYCAMKTSCTPNENLPTGKSVCRKVVETCDNVGIHKIILSGGEPLILRNLAEIVSYLTGNGIGISICTNGTLLSTQLLDDLRIAGLSKLVIGVDVSKVLTCKNSSDTSYSSQIVQTLRILEKSNTPYEINIVFLPMIEPEINKLADWLRDFLPTSINLIEPQTCGRLAISDRDIRCNWDENRLEETAANLMALIEPVRSVLVSPRCQDNDCPSERLVFGITPDGTLDQCPWKHHLNVTTPKQSARPRSLTTPYSS